MKKKLDRCGDKFLKMKVSKGDECPFILQVLDKRYRPVLLHVIRCGTYVQKDIDSVVAKPRSGIEDFP